jgi:hypothetical protein
LRRAGIIVIATLSLGVVSGVAAYQTARPGVKMEWREIAWPFPRDGWPAGRAFRCLSPNCGEGNELYVRAKLGFCNCDSGVADDDEVDRVADLDLISPRFAAAGPGRAVRLEDLAGRLRRYDLDLPDGSRRAAVGIALSHRCDLLVAVAQGARDAAGVERPALAFLAERHISRWMMAALGAGH